MINDRFTSRVLGGVILLMIFLVSVSCFMFTNPEIRHRPTFPLVVLGPSLPFVAVAVWLLRKK